MKWTGIYLIGYVILVGGLVAALWKMGILARIGVAWTLIGVVIAIGIGIMLAVSSSGRKDNIEITGSERCPENRALPLKRFAEGKRLLMAKIKPCASRSTKSSWSTCIWNGCFR